MNTWVICLTAPDAGSLAPLRLTRGIEVAEKEPFVWVRGAGKDDKLELTLRALPAVARYELSSGNRLRNVASSIPAETLPALNWQPLNTWFGVQTPAHRRNEKNERDAKDLRPVSLRIVRSTEERPIELLMTGIREWHEFALSAPEVRLRQLRFAVDEKGHVIIRGRPLPPLPGWQFVLHGNVAVQAGFRWEPAVSADVIARRLALSSDALALFHEDGTFSRIESEQFVPATRSAVRETAAGFSMQ